MHDTTAQTATSQKESTRQALLEQLKDPTLTEREIDAIWKKLEIVKNHG